MKTPSLLETLATRPLLCDGATGTELQSRGLRPGECGEDWNVSASERVADIHRHYVAAGSELVTTNTFGATSVALGRHGLGQRVAELNRAGAALAREVAGSTRWVLGDVGPVGEMLEPWGMLSHRAAEEAFREQSAALLAGGVDAILVETMSDPEEAALAIRAARDAGAGVVVATFAFQNSPAGFRTMMGATVTQCVEAALAAGAQIVGTNCGVHLALPDYVRLAGELVAAAGTAPVIVQPNAGAPRLVDGRAVYDESAAALAAAVPSFLSAGVRIVGGCCGTTPVHIAAMAAAMR